MPTPIQRDALIRPIAAARVSRDGRDFWRHVQITPGCWYWTGYVNEHGYGKYTVAVGHCVRVHRWAYQLMVGPVPDGLDVDHHCHTADLTCPGGRDCPHRKCVNPAHLRPATRSQNLADARFPNKAKTHCPQQHPYSGDNLYVNSAGRRECRTCRRARDRRRTAWA